MKKSCRNTLICTGISGVISFIMACCFTPFLNSIVHLKMSQMLALGPDSYSFDYWKNPPVPVLFELYMFDIVNPDEVMQGGHPSLLEKGPYTYRVSLEKYNITFHPNNTVTYRQRQTFVFDRELSVGWDNETFTTINAPLFTIGSLMKYEMPFMQDAVNLLLELYNETALIRVSVHDIFWGYQDPFLELAKDMLAKFHIKSDLITGIFGFYMGEVAKDMLAKFHIKSDLITGIFGFYMGEVAKDMLAKFHIKSDLITGIFGFYMGEVAKNMLAKFHIKSDLITGIFGFYMGRNKTDDGQYTVGTGTDDLSNFLIIDNWNEEKKLDYWTTPEANMINGTDGSLYPPFVTTDRNLQMYDSNIYRSISMAYSRDSSVRDIPTMMFVVEDKEFANATVNPANAGFCTPRNQCIPSGLLNCSSMGHGAPLYVSLPHFLGADPYYYKLVSGLRPNRELHQPYFHLHQLTGVCLSAGRRYQLNVQIKEYSFISKTKGLSLSYVPVMWINGIAKIDDRIADMFQNQIELPLNIIVDAHYAFFAIGPLMALASFLVLLRDRRREKKKTSQNGHLVSNGTTHVQTESETNRHTVSNGAHLQTETSPLLGS